MEADDLVRAELARRRASKLERRRSRSDGHAGDAAPANEGSATKVDKEKVTAYVFFFFLLQTTNVPFPRPSPQRVQGRARYAL